MKIKLYNMMKKYIIERKEKKNILLKEKEKKNFSREKRKIYY